MKRSALLFLAVLLAAVSAMAQNVTAMAQDVAAGSASMTPQSLRFGFYSQEAAMRQVPGYDAARQSVDQLRKQYADELKRAEDEFNEKYELFLQGQRDFAPSIREKRQAELQELLEKNIAFKAKAEQLLAQAEEEALRPLRERLLAAVQSVGRAKGFAFVVNTDANALPYIDASLGVDVSADIVAALGHTEATH